MTTDPIADMLTRIRNAQHARKEFVNMPHSKQKFAILKLLEKHEFIADVNEIKEGKFPEIKVNLKTGAEFQFNRISKAGRRIYRKSAEIKPVLSGLGISVISTSVGFLTGKEAKEKNLGGEVICEIY
jgi:small subunit ribosomal protein S8